MNWRSSAESSATLSAAGNGVVGDGVAGGFALAAAIAESIVAGPVVAGETSGEEGLAVAENSDADEAGICSGDPVVASGACGRSMVEEDARRGSGHFESDEQPAAMRTATAANRVVRRNPSIQSEQETLRGLHTSADTDIELLDRKELKNAVFEKYSVVEGDTLPAIANKYYGDYDAWKILWEVNKFQIENSDLKAGQVLLIPKIINRESR